MLWTLGVSKHGRGKHKNSAQQGLTLLPSYIQIKLISVVCMRAERPYISAKIWAQICRTAFTVDVSHINVRG
jgi:hypothetical protein